jgi:CoA:oxalate CoA-transferase
MYPHDETPDRSALPNAQRPLDGMLVLDFSQFLAGPVAAMRLADLGARVIKIERPGVGELGRGLAFAGAYRAGEAVSFHAMNRNKESIVADLKDPAELDMIRQLVARADVMIQNFRPGVIERIGLGYPTVAALNARLVYASITGYGTAGPWRNLPGQDLLAQSVSGLPWLSGSAEDGPVPVGISIADLIGSCHLASGVLALLVRRGRTGRGGLIETSLLEGVLDLQFELLSAYLNDATLKIDRGSEHGANPFLAAPYGVYPTCDGYLAIAMTSVPDLGELLELPALEAFSDPATWWDARAEIERSIAERLVTEPTAHWLQILQRADVWCTEVLTVRELVEHDGFKVLRMTQETVRHDESGAEHRILTTRSPLRLDGQLLTSTSAAPRLGEHTEAILAEFGLGDRANGKASKPA